jgi:site-specific recombinase XerD
MKMNSTENTLYRYLDLYERQLGRNKSQHTIVNYMSDLKQFINYLAVKAMSYNLDNFEREQFLDYLDYLKENFAPATVHRKAISLNGFLTFLNRTGRIKKTPFVDGQELQEYLPVIPKKKVKTLTANSIKNLVFVSNNIMEECIVRVLFDGALRVSELVNIKWEDIEFDFQRTILNVKGKGKQGLSKSRSVLLSPTTSERIQQMKDSRDWESIYLFESERTKKQISTRRVNQILDKISDGSGVGKISSHIFRASQATNLLEKGLEIAYVSNYLGHSSPIVTAKSYLDTDRKMHDKVENLLEEI